MAERRKYVVGFLFDPTLSKVVLVRKQRPEWQKGLLNGVGGKVGDHIPGETPEQAMHREFQEEAGMDGINWIEFMNLKTPHSDITFFRAVGPVHRAAESNGVADHEPIEIHEVHDVMDRTDTIANLRWCIQMARTFHFGERAQRFEVTEIMVPEWVGAEYEIKDGAWIGK